MIEERWHLWGKQNFWQWNQSTSWRTEIFDALWHTWTHTTGQKRVLTAPASYRPCVHAPLVDNAQGKRHVTVRGNWVLDRRMTYFLRSVDQSDMKRTVSQLIQQMALVMWNTLPPLRIELKILHSVPAFMRGSCALTIIFLTFSIY
jgi:hypothetical protein